MVSIIVPTINREQVLCATLTCLFAQDYPDLEILVVDQTGQHEEATETFLRDATAAGHLRHIRISTPGVTNARNVGIRHARGDIVLFCDDDVVIGPDWAARHAENYADPTIGGVTGQVLEPGEVPTDARPVGRITFCGRLVENFTSVHRMDVQHIKGGNMSFRKSVAQQAGLFDLRFSVPALLEEADFAFRVRRLGHRIVYDPRASLKHLAWPSGGHQTRTYDRVSYYYHFLRSKTLFFLKNVNRWSLPCCLLVCWGRAIVTGLFEAHSLRALYRLAVQAIWDGYCLYRQGDPECPAHEI
jgi:glycosyltransferase involved in cell wall biosynthesis